MQQNLGFLKRSQKFLKNTENRKYSPILEQLYHLSTRHHNNLPTLFSLTLIYNFSAKDVEFVLSILYPERNYSCNRINDHTIYCISS